MARKKDAEEDQASKAILDQLQTKTVGAPPASTGLTGDQLPETVFDVEDFDLVKNQVTLQLSNLELLNVLNAIGQITGTQSVSGPIAGTVDVINFTSSSSGTAVGKTESGFYSNKGEVWKIFGPSLSVGGASGSIQHELRLINDGATLEILDFSSTGGSLRPTTEEGFIGGEIYVSYPAYLVYEATGTFTSSGLSLGVVRVR